jgi:membrane protein required for colicin V production
MNTLDAVVLIPLLYFTYKGFQNGLVKEVLSIVGIVLAIFLTFGYLEEASVLLKPYYGDSSYLPFLTGATVFLGTLLAVNIIAYLIKQFLEIAMLSMPNRLFGAAFGLLKSSIVVSALLLFLAGFDMPGDETRTQSMSYPIIINVAPTAYNAVASVYPGARSFTDAVEKTIDDYNPLNNLPFSE